MPRTGPNREFDLSELGLNDIELNYVMYITSRGVKSGARGGHVRGKASRGGARPKAVRSKRARSAEWMSDDDDEVSSTIFKSDAKRITSLHRVSSTETIPAQFCSCSSFVGCNGLKRVIASVSMWHCVCVRCCAVLLHRRMTSRCRRHLRRKRRRWEPPPQTMKGRARAHFHPAPPPEV